jgi:outer membrane protein assembly factor BamB
LALAALALAACSRGPATTWPGISADSQYVYVAQGQQVHAVDVTNGQSAWLFPTTAGVTITQIVSEPGISSDIIVVGSEGTSSNLYSGILYGLDRNKGTQIWCLAFDQKGTDSQGCTTLAKGNQMSCFITFCTPVDDRILGGIALTNDVAYFGLASGMVYAVNAKTGQDLWHFQASRDVWGTPLVAGDTVYVGSLDHNVYALSRDDGKPRWHKDMGAAVAGTPAFDAGTLFVGTFANTLVALDTASCETDCVTKWTYPTQNWVWSGPEIAQGVLYFTDVSGYVYAADEATGQPKWTPVKPGGQMRAEPVLAGNNLYLGDYDGNLFALNPADGSTRWQHNLKDQSQSGQILVPPVVVSDTLVVALYNGSNCLVAYSTDGNYKWLYPQCK